MSLFHDSCLKCLCWLDRSSYNTQNQEESQRSQQQRIESQMMNQAASLADNQSSSSEGPVLSTFDLDGIADLFNRGKVRKNSVIVLVGAGMSTAAGIPDFRSPSSGIYANLAKYKLPQPEAVFEINYFKNNPAPFYDLSKSLLPGKLRPTLSHYFVRLLNEKGFLLRCFSQNVDCLESLSGLNRDKLCLAHGSFETGHCLRCNAEYSLDWMRAIVNKGEIPHCTETANCKGLIKPDVKFFGERLDSRFFRLAKEDFPKCDLLIIIGSSLTVMPFAELINKVPPRCPRLLINKTKSGHSMPALLRFFKPDVGLKFDRKDNIRDAVYIGDCDEGCLDLADRMGWRDNLLMLQETRKNELDSQEARISQQQGVTSDVDDPRNSETIPLT